MAAVLILCSLGLMGWSVLGLINPLRFAQGSRARAFGVGVIGFALLMVGGAMLPPTPEPTSTATSSPPEPVQESESSVDSDEPAEFSAHTKQLLALYKELHSFKDDPTFHEVGFGTCCRFHDWQTRVEALRSKAELETLADVGVLPGDLLMLGMEYMRSKGRPTEYTETMEPHYESGLTALAGMGGSLMPDDPAEPASEEFAASAPASPTPPPPPRDSAPGAADGAPRQQRYHCAVRLPRVWQPNCGSAERRSFSELVLAAVRVLTSGLDRPVVVGVRRQVQRWRCRGRGRQLEHRLERTGSEVCCFVP